MSAEVKEGAAEVRSTRAAEVAEERSALAVVLRDVRLLLIALWLGGAVFFSAVVAPTVFSVLRSHHVRYANQEAGSIVTASLAVLNTGGFVIALLLLAGALLFRRALSRRAFLVEVVSLSLLAVATGVGQWVIAARMVELRARMGVPIDDVAVDDPLRISFNNLHGYSVAALGVAIIAAAVALLLIARRNQRSEVRGQ